MMELESTSCWYPSSSQEHTEVGESTASEKSFQFIVDMIYKHDEEIYNIERVIYNLGNAFNSLTRILAEINEKLNKLESIEGRLAELEKRFGRQEGVIIVKEIPFDEAKKMIEDYLSDKKGEIVTPLELADALQIPYETAHEIFLQLVKEGKLEIKDIE